MEYLPFRIAGRDFVVDSSRVWAILPFQGDAQSYAVPIVDLRQRLALPAVVYGRRPYLVVVETRTVGETKLAGFVADYISDLISAPHRCCRRGKLHAGGRPKRVLDPDSLLN